ncbi:glucose 1-dehydrogenase [Nakamurella sp. YIM 132087]|uniref:Glucose 1-dehydrogenase n=1 Tax=Nakamurella alba TaxID=2665158 RepID=A0A7K1FEM6_9ACTN|nr:SDR family NAD(P)-dependent oxidoreductase [Nakamurella alba]MTD12557.1 glucose 1-dehydrogenase [Nakamurella alba]
MDQPGHPAPRPSLGALLSLQGRTAVVTGAGRGIGAAIADRLAEAGADVLLADLDGTAVEQGAAELRQRWGTRCTGHELDVRNPRSVDALAALADGPDGRLRIWVNNAGIYPAAALAELELEQWQQVQDINATGTFLGARAAARRMTGHPDRHGHVIVNLSSVAGLTGRPRMASYVAAKHAVSGLTRALAVELGPSGIRVVAVAPGFVDTQAFRERASTPAGARQNAMASADLGNAVPLGRAASADDVARVVLWAVSDLASYVSGVVLPIDGGMLAR